MNSRTSNSIRNSVIAMFSQLLSIILSFITRTIFIKTLGANYLGVNGLFTGILSMLTLAEMGFGTAIVYEMYKPLAKKDEKIVSALMNMYANVYQIIGVVIGLIGILIIPFLNYLIKGNPNIPHLEFIYLLFLLNSVVSYFFTYKRSIIIANQDGYIDNLNTITFLIIQNVFQMLILIFTKQYILYLLIQIISTLLSNIFITRKADKLFPYLKQYKNERVDKVTKHNITKNVIAMISSKLGSVVVSGTDNLLISSFIGIYSVGLYSNYVLIVNTVKGIIMQLLNAVTASVGNLTATEDEEKAYLIFERVYFINFSITYFCTILIFVLINPLINIWIGNHYLLDFRIVLIVVINFYVVQMRQPAIIFINTYGLFWMIKWKSIVEALINLVASLILLGPLKMGVLGVLLGTLISNICTNVWWEPYVTFKYGFKVNLRKYFIMYILDGLKCGLGLLIINYVFNNLSLTGWAELLTKAFISIGLAFLLFTVMNFKNKNFKYVLNLINKMLFSKSKL
jgi:O-antigen/teichoic acid export membrane protein